MATSQLTYEEAAWLTQQFGAGRKQVELSRETNISQSQICLAIRIFCDCWSGFAVSVIAAYGDDRRPYAATAVQNYQKDARYSGKLSKPDGNMLHEQWCNLHGYWQARREHAARLRDAGLTLAAIGTRLGVSGSQISLLLAQ